MQQLLKTLQVFLIVLIFPCTQVTAQDNDLASIQKVMDMQKESWSKGDLEGFMQGYWNSDSLMFVGSRGVTYGWKNTLAMYKKSYPTKAALGRLEFELIKMDMLNDTNCFVVGKFILSYSDREDITGHFTLLFKKIDNQWVIVADHTS